MPLNLALAASTSDIEQIVRNNFNLTKSLRIVLLIIGTGLVINVKLNWMEIGKMLDNEFEKYIEENWSFLIHEEGVWGGNPGTPIHNIDSMDKKHLEHSIAMIIRWKVTLPKDKADRERLEKIKQKKLNELEKALKIK